MLTQHFPQNIKEEYNPFGLEKACAHTHTPTVAPNKKGVDREAGTWDTLWKTFNPSVSIYHTQTQTHILNC